MNPINKFPNVFSDYKGRMYTKTEKDVSFFEEKIFRKGKDSFREWDPNRSKLGAAIAKRISQIGFKEDSKVLYLGASHGYTPSFVSDMVSKGCIYALEIAPVVARDLVYLCESRKNMIPLIANANHPETYNHIGKVDLVFQDISQKNQVEIFLKNCDEFLESGGFGLLAIKARSIDVTRKPKDLFKQVRAELERHIGVVDYRELDPFERAHAFFVCKKK